MKAFITGATGFWGTLVIKYLAKEGWDIIILKKENSVVGEFQNIKNIEYAMGDITDIESLRKGMPEEVDVVFQIDGCVSQLTHQPKHTSQNIIGNGTRNLVDVCLEKKVGRFIYTSTELANGIHSKKYFNETLPLTERGRRPYTNSKKLAEKEIAKGLANGLDAIIMQPSAVFGSFDKATWSKMFLKIERGLPFSYAPLGGGSVCLAM